MSTTKKNTKKATKKTAVKRKVARKAPAKRKVAKKPVTKKAAPKRKAVKKACPPSPVAKGKLTAAKRKKLPKALFALPERKALPIHDASHARNAMARLAMMINQGHVTPKEAATARRHILAAYKCFGIKPGPDLKSGPRRAVARKPNPHMGTKHLALKGKTFYELKYNGGPHWEKLKGLAGKSAAMTAKHYLDAGLAVLVPMEHATQAHHDYSIEHGYGDNYESPMYKPNPAANGSRSAAGDYADEKGGARIRAKHAGTYGSEAEFQKSLAHKWVISRQGDAFLVTIGDPTLGSSKLKRRFSGKAAQEEIREWVRDSVGAVVSPEHVVDMTGLGLLKQVRQRNPVNLPNVGSHYGAPMGRRAQALTGTKIKAFRVHLDSGGYDKGGAYWGIGQKLWQLTDEHGNESYVRAPTMAAAKASVRKSNPTSRKPPSGKKISDKKLGELMHHWHGSMSDPIYGVGSLYFAGKTPAQADIDAAAYRLQGLRGASTSTKDRAELQLILRQLELRAGKEYVVRTYQDRERASKRARKPNPAWTNRTAPAKKGKAQATKILITFSEAAEHEKMPITVSGPDIWRQANRALASLAMHIRRGDRSYYKTDFTVHFDDGEKYQGRIDLYERDKAEANLAKHIAETAQHMAKSDSPYVKPADRKKWAELLDKYQIGCDGCYGKVVR